MHPQPDDRAELSKQSSPAGPLVGVRVLELGGIGPAPFGGMILADLGADVIRIERPGASNFITPYDVLGRGRRSVALDLKAPTAQDAVLKLVDTVDVCVEGFRPGVAERLGLGPDVCLARNERLIYARMTGYGQTGPLARAAGHDINYLAIAGALHAIGPSDRPPTPPLNYVGDFGGGGAFLVIGVLAALYERSISGRGQVVDAAMVDGVGAITALFHGMQSAGMWSDTRGANALDGGAHFYGTYETAGGEFVAVGAVEPQFYKALLDKLGLDPAEWPQMERDRWPELRRHLADIFRTRTRAEWQAHFEDADACLSPVLTLDESALHAHAVARGSFVDVDGVRQPAPAPRLSRTPGAVRSGAPSPGAHTAEVLREAGFDAEDIRQLAGATAPV